MIKINHCLCYNYLTHLKEVNYMDKYECLLCSYVYDPALGDPDSGVEPGTPFEDLPEDWVCPDCGAPQDQFRKLES